MSIKDIIRSDSDRLFIVDPECYIIFTGDSLNDIQPFIRIGNWIDMPVELIPLIENIIISDSIIGNPSLEQFNIDIRRLATNRYIGSKHVITNFFEYQRTFNIDLTSATTVDIEKDIPELSKEKVISEKNQFMGIFYRNGNFKIMHRCKTVVDLHETAKNPLNFDSYHNSLNDAFKNSDRYAGSGFVLIENNPIFYHNRYFTSYLFPSGYYTAFSQLGIDPGKIRAVSYPSKNTINLTPLIKWKNSTKGSLRLFSNNNDFFALQRLYSRCSIKRDNFAAMNYKTDDGLTVKNFRDSFNIELQFEKNDSSAENCLIMYLKGEAGIRESLKKTPDLCIVPYSVFEDAAMLLNNSGLAIAIIDDGNKNLSRLGSDQHVILRKSYQYELIKSSSAESLISSISIDEGLWDLLNSSAELFENYFDKIQKSQAASRHRSLFNLAGIIRIELHTTKDRKKSSFLKPLSQKVFAEIDRDAVFSDNTGYKTILALHDKGVFSFITGVTNDSAAPLVFDEIEKTATGKLMNISRDTANNHKRILTDRKRLMALLSRYIQSPQYHKVHGSEIMKLKKAIERRREDYSKEDLSFDTTGLQENSKKYRMSDTGDSDSKNDKTKKNLIICRTKSACKKIPRKIRLSAPFGALLILLILFAILLTRDYIKIPKASKSEAVIQSKEIDDKFRKLGEQLNIKVDNSDIYVYANDVAVKNGYHKIAETNLRDRNPDWIYPKNVFMMLDGQRVTVSKGDTLWNLSKNKLIESIIRFDEIIKKINALPASARPQHVIAASKLARTKSQLEIIKKLRELYPTKTKDSAAQDESR